MDFMTMRLHKAPKYQAQSLLWTSETEKIIIRNYNYTLLFISLQGK